MVIIPGNPVGRSGHGAQRAGLTAGGQRALALLLQNPRLIKTLGRYYGVSHRLVEDATVNFKTEVGVRRKVEIVARPTVKIQAQLQLKSDAPQGLREVLPEHVLGEIVEGYRGDIPFEVKTPSSFSAVRDQASNLAFKTLAEHLISLHEQSTGKKDILTPPNVRAPQPSFFTEPGTWEGQVAA
ncbi:MAG: hypothetical protein ABIE84_06780 [bacterium]